MCPAWPWREERARQYLIATNFLELGGMLHYMITKSFVEVCDG